MGEARRARCGGGQSFPALSRRATRPPLHVLTNPEALRTPSFWGFMEPSFHRHK